MGSRFRAHPFMLWGLLALTSIKAAVLPLPNTFDRRQGQYDFIIVGGES
jgi:hypothetical protein